MLNEFFVGIRVNFKHVWETCKKCSKYLVVSLIRKHFALLIHCHKENSLNFTICRNVFNKFTTVKNRPEWVN